MTDDTPFSDLVSDWRRQTADLDRLRRLVERRRRRTRLILLARILGTGVALLFCAWFIRLALSGGPPTFALGGFVLLIAVPLMLLEVAGTARLLRVGHDDTPAGVLRRARDQAAIARHLLWGTRVAAVLLAASAAGLLLLFATGRASMKEALILAPFWALTALVGWAWQAHRAPRLAAEIDQCELLLAELGEANGG